MRPRPDRPCARARRWARERSGASAPEFALLAFPFLVLFCVILDAGYFFLTQQTLDISVSRAARLLRTGEFQDLADGSDPSERLRRLMCSSRLVLFRCDEMRIDVTRTASFTSNQVPPAYDKARKDWSTSFGTRFDCPQGGDVVSLRAAVPVLRPFSFLDFTGQSMGGGRSLMTATEIFRTEPYVGKNCS